MPRLSASRNVCFSDFTLHYQIQMNRTDLNKIFFFPRDSRSSILPTVLGTKDVRSKILLKSSWGLVFRNFEATVRTAARQQSHEKNECKVRIESSSSFCRGQYANIHTLGCPESRRPCSTTASARCFVT